MGILSFRKREYSGEELFVIDQSQFERIVAETMRAIGLKDAEVLDEVSDERVSIKAKHRKRDILVKCVFYGKDHLVGEGHVQDIAEALADYGADRAYLVTTSRFSHDAKRESLEGDLRNRLYLVDGEKLNSWRSTSGLAPVAKHEGRKLREYSGEALFIADPYQFERIVAETIGELGYEKVAVTRASGDRGVDVRAELPTKSGITVSVIMQCKLYSEGNTVGHSYIRDLIGTMMIHEADEAYLITTSGFSQGAYSEVADGFEDRVFLVDGEMFNGWRRRSGLAPIVYLDVARTLGSEHSDWADDEGEAN